MNDNDFNFIQFSGCGIVRQIIVKMKEEGKRG